MLVLGIESSCDDTGLALVSESGVAASVLASQVPVHALFGGVVPELASREHARLMPPLLDKLLRDSGLPLAAVDRIAVTRGPGLLGCLLVGLAFAKGLSLTSGIPLIGVNHLHAHLLAAGMENPLPFPALGVLVSGGHTHLLRMESPAHMPVLGKTLDDAAGEACDKFAKLLGLPYPGGALLDALGRMGAPDSRLFPRPYIHNDNCDFSFSGLKTAAATWLGTHREVILPPLPPGCRHTRESLREAPEALKNVAASYLTAIAETLRVKAERALDSFDSRAVVVAGGVAANSFVREVFQKLSARRGLPLLLPSLPLCADNGVMVARTGLLLAGLCHGLDLAAVPRGRAIPEDYRRAEGF